MTPLIDTLAAADLDWLAFELIDGIKRGREPEEPAEALDEARASARQPAPPPERIVVQSPVVSAMPLYGDQQIEWAACYVVDRLEESIAALEASLDNLDDLLAASDEATSALKAPGRVVLIVEDGDSSRKSDRSAVERSRRGLDGLRIAVERWAIAARQEPLV